MTEEWLIDGYNLLHCIPHDQGKTSRTSREKMFSALASFASVSGHRVRVVLDGAGDSHEFSSLATAHFEVIYSQKVSADTAIEKILYERKNVARLVVVTNDRAIANMARGSGARVLSGNVFLELLGETKKESAAYLLKEKVRTHGFNRPLDKKLRDKGFCD